MIQNKLVESWLDNQGERRYQPALIQLLISEGWKVLHNTRHGPLEYGKDVIARNPIGILCALQLKGNPGSRLTKNEAQGLIPQFTEAIEVEIPTSYGRKPNERHKTILVTNGEIDEEARELFDRVAERVKNPLCPCDDVEYWARGELLSRFSQKVQDIWPVTVEGLSEAIKIFGEDGLSTPLPERIAVSLRAAFGMFTPGMKAPEKSSKITSIFLLAEVLKSPWYRTENHHALFQISVIASVYALQFADVDKRLDLVRGYSDIALSHARDLVEECKRVEYASDANFAVRSPLSEVDVFSERGRLIAEVVSALVLSGRFELAEKAYLRELIAGSFHPGSYWGQFVVPSMIVRYWAWRRLDATLVPDRALLSILSGYMFSAEQHQLPDRISNASEYYRFEHVLHSITGGLIGEVSDISKDDTRNHMSFGRALLQMLALRNWKQSCKAFWRRFSNKMHGSTVVPMPDFFSPLISVSGSTVSHQFYAKQWNDLVNEAIDASQSPKLDQFGDLAWLAVSYLSVAPHRAEHEFIMALDDALSGRWYGKHHRPGDPMV